MPTAYTGKKKKLSEYVCLWHDPYDPYDQENKLKLKNIIKKIF